MQSSEKEARVEEEVDPDVPNEAAPLIRLVYRDRQILTRWKSDFEEFRWDVGELLSKPHVVGLSARLEKAVLTEMNVQNWSALDVRSLEVTILDQPDTWLPVARASFRPDHLFGLWKKDTKLPEPLLCLHYMQRAIVSLWSPGFESFKMAARRLFEIPKSHRICFTVETKKYPGEHMEIDPEVWPLIRDEQGSHIWISNVAHGPPTVDDPARRIMVFYMGDFEIVDPCTHDLEAFKNAARKLFQIPEGTRLVIFADHKKEWEIKEVIDPEKWLELRNTGNISVITIAAPEINRPTRRPDLIINVRGGCRFPIVLENFSKAVIGEVTRLIERQEGIPREHQHLYVESSAEFERVSSPWEFGKRLLSRVGRALSHGPQVVPSLETLDRLVVAERAEDGRRDPSTALNTDNLCSLKKLHITRGSVLYLVIEPPAFNAPVSPPVVTSSIDPDQLEHNLKPLCVEYQGRILWTKRDSDFEGFKHRLLRFFEVMQGHCVTFSAILEDFGMTRVEIDPIAWPAVRRAITKMWLSEVEPE